MSLWKAARELKTTEKETNLSLLSGRVDQLKRDYLFTQLHKKTK